MVSIVYSFIPDHTARKFARQQKLSERPFFQRGLDRGEGALGFLIRRSDHLEQRGGGSCCKWMRRNISVGQFFRERERERDISKNTITIGGSTVNYASAPV